MKEINISELLLLFYIVLHCCNLYLDENLKNNSDEDSLSRGDRKVFKCNCTQIIPAVVDGTFMRTSELIHVTTLRLRQEAKLSLG